MWGPAHSRRCPQPRRSHRRVTARHRGHLCDLRPQCVAFTAGVQSLASPLQGLAPSVTLSSPRSTQVQSTRVVRVWVWSLKVARKSRSGIGNGIGNILESLSTLSRLVSRSRERTFLCTSDPIHMRCGRLLHTADVCSRTQTTTDKPPRPEVPPHPFHSWSKVVTAGSSLSTAGSGKALFGPSRRCRSAIRSARW